MGTTAEKLSYLNTTKTKIKDVLNLGGANITNETFREYADKIKDRYLYYMLNGTQVIWNNWNKVSGTGTSLTLNNTEEAPMSLVYKGNTQQTGTPTPSSPIPVQVVSGNNSINVVGKNLIDKSNGNIGKYYNWAVGRSGALQTSTLNWASNKINCEDNTTYTLSVNPVCTDIRIHTFDVNGNISQASTGANVKSVSLTTTSNDKQIAISLNYDRTTNITQELIDTLQIQLEKGATATTYEAYTGASYPITLPEGMFLGWIPNTNYYDKIDKSTGKNVLSTENIHNGAFTTIEQLQTDAYTETGNTKYRSVKIDNLPAGTYTITINWDKTAWLIRMVTDNTLTTLTRARNDWTFTTTTTGLFGITFRTNDSIDFNDNDYTIMLNEGTTALPYEPYGTGWYLKKEIGKVVLNGSENWNERTNTSGNKQFYAGVSIPDVYTNNGQYSTHFPTYSKALWNYGTVGMFAVMQQPHQFCAVVPSDLVLADFKTSLGTNNLVAYFTLATPTYETITDTTLLSQLEALKKSYENVTNISQVNNDLPFELDITALEEMN